MSDIHMTLDNCERLIDAYQFVHGYPILDTRGFFHWLQRRGLWWTSQAEIDNTHQWAIGQDIHFNLIKMKKTLENLK